MAPTDTSRALRRKQATLLKSQFHWCSKKENVQKLTISAISQFNLHLAPKHIYNHQKQTFGIHCPWLENNYEYHMSQNAVLGQSSLEQFSISSQLTQTHSSQELDSLCIQEV
jgi:hypothetical protein